MPRKPKTTEPQTISDSPEGLVAHNAIVSHPRNENRESSASHISGEAHAASDSHTKVEAHNGDAINGLAKTKLVVRRLYDGQKLRIQGDLRFQRLERDGLLHLISPRCPLCSYAEDGELLAHCVHHHELDELDKKREAVFRALKKEHKGSKAEFLLLRARDAEQESEKWYERIVADDINELPVWTEYLLHVKGIGPRLAGLLIANIAPISRFPNVAKLWAYCGLHVIDGKAAKRKAGEKANWSNELKTTAFKIADSFIKAGSPYRSLFDEYKARIIERETKNGNTIYQKDVKRDRWIPISQTTAATPCSLASHKTDETQSPDASQDVRAIHGTLASHQSVESPLVDANHRTGEAQKSSVPEWTLGRINNMARRFMVKMFLSHLWAKWRELEGLEVTMPYALTLPGHTHYKRPEDYMGQPKKE